MTGLDFATNHSLVSNSVTRVGFPSLILQEQTYKNNTTKYATNFLIGGLAQVDRTGHIDVGTNTQKKLTKCASN